MSEENGKEFALMGDEELRFKLTVDETNFILDAIGKQPTNTGAWTLLQKMKLQAETQIEIMRLNSEESEE